MHLLIACPCVHVDVLHRKWSLHRVRSLSTMACQGLQTPLVGTTLSLAVTSLSTNPLEMQLYSCQAAL